MSEYVYKERTKGDLPHWHPPGATLFVTFRLAETVPQSILRIYDAQKKWLQAETKRLFSSKLKADSSEVAAHEKRLQDFRREWFVKFEGILHQAENGPTWLKGEAVAAIIAEALQQRDGEVYRLDAYCIMPNHVHTVFAPFLSAEELSEVMLPEGLRFISRNPPLDRIMQSLKGWTSWQSNRALCRKGTFWEQESYDHVIRHSEEFERIVRYVLNNPVKAGLVGDGQAWKWSYRRQPEP